MMVSSFDFAFIESQVNPWNHLFIMLVCGLGDFYLELRWSRVDLVQEVNFSWLFPVFVFVLYLVPCMAIDWFCGMGFGCGVSVAINGFWYCWCLVHMCADLMYSWESDLFGCEKLLNFYLSNACIWSNKTSLGQDTGDTRASLWSETILMRVVLVVDGMFSLISQNRAWSEACLAWRSQYQHCLLTGFY